MLIDRHFGRSGRFFLNFFRFGKKLAYDPGIPAAGAMATREDIDDLDRTIIALLAEDGRLAASEIAARIGEVSERTVRNRIAALLQNRHIVISAIPDPTTIGRPVQADLLIEVEPGRVDHVAAIVGEFDEVGYLAATSGNFGLNAEVFFNTNAELLEFTENSIGKIPGVRRVVINLILRMYKVFGTRTTALSQRAAANGETPHRIRKAK